MDNSANIPVVHLAPQAGATPPSDIVILDRGEYDSIQDELNQTRLETLAFTNAVSDMESEGLDVSMFKNGTMRHLFKD